MSITVTLLIQIVAFVLLIWFVNKFLWAPMSVMMEERQKKIADGLSAAEKGKKELELAEQRAKEVLQEAKVQAQEVLSQAEKRGTEIVNEAKEKAVEEVERVKASATAEIEQEASAAREALRAEIGQLAVNGAAKILAREVDEKAHADLIDALAKEI